MSRADFPIAEFTSRLSRVRAAMAEARLDWFIAFHPVSIHWLTGSDAKSYQAFQCLFISAADGRRVILTREGERNEFEADAVVDAVHGWGGGEPEDPIAAFERLAAALGLGGERVGIEVPAYYLHPHHYLRIKAILGDALAAEATDLIHRLKLVKSPRELDYIRAASRIADAAMRTFIAALKEGRSELEVAGEVYRALLAGGSGLPASTLNLVSGERAGFSHGAPTARRLRSGDTGNVEFGAAYRRYTVTIGRQFSLGPPSARVAELYRIVREAGDAAIAAIRAGVKASVPHEAARSVIAAVGYDRYRVHTTGYGIAPGFPPSWGEPLHMFSGCEDVLEAGMVLSVEPPIFIGAERLGVRIIDNVLVTESGVSRLSQLPRDLVVA